jgi:hypothetical protein
MYVAPRWPYYCKWSSVYVRLKMLIDEHGEASAAEIIDDPQPQACGAMLQERALAASYIPAFHEGKFVPSQYVDVYFTPDGVIDR